MKIAAPLPIKLHCRAGGWDLGRSSEVLWGGLGTESFVFAVFFVRKMCNENFYPPAPPFAPTAKIQHFQYGEASLTCFGIFQVVFKADLQVFPSCRVCWGVPLQIPHNCCHGVPCRWFQHVQVVTETLKEILRVMMKTLLSLQPMVASGQPLMYRPTRIIGNRLFLS